MAEEPVAKKSRTGAPEAEEGAGGSGDEHEFQCDVVFRSYVPRDEKLRKFRRKQAEVPDMVATIAERVVALTQRREQEDIVSLAPKKAAWDLARDLEPRLDQLAKATDRAILTMLKEGKVPK